MGQAGRTTETLQGTRPRRTRPSAFTLIELVVVIAILAVLLAVFLPALTSVRAAGQSVVCASNMKSVTMEFRFFGDGTSERGRGDSRQLGPNRFWINDFQDSMYHLDEFWDLPDATLATLDASESLMMCPSGAERVRKRRGLPCGQEAIRPLENVSIAVNMRLYRGVFDVKGKKLLASPVATHVTTRILERPYVPLVMDVDGHEAVAKGVEPFYIAPPLSAVDDPYASGRYWSPSSRHAGKTVVGFVGGHVLSSEKPETQRWDWAHQPRVGR